MVFAFWGVFFGEGVRFFVCVVGVEGVFSLCGYIYFARSAIN